MPYFDTALVVIIWQMLLGVVALPNLVRGSQRPCGVQQSEGGRQRNDGISR